MKKRLLTVLLAVCLVLALGTVSALADDTVEEANSPETLASALSGTASTIKLTDDITVTSAVTISREVTIDLNGHKLSNNETGSFHTVVVSADGGNLTVIDSGSQSGVIDNVVHGKAALVNNGTAVLSGGTFDRSHEAGCYAPYGNGGNSYYTVENYGTMIINDGVTIQQDGTANGGTNGDYSSLLHNGWADGNKNISKSQAILTINGGTFSGGLNTLKNDDFGDVTINGGNFYNDAQAIILNYNVATIDDGVFELDGGTAKQVILNGYISSSDNRDQGKLTINGGTFDGNGEDILVTMSSVTSIGNVEIIGGDFTGDFNITGGAGSVTVSDAANVTGDIINSSSSSAVIKDGATVSGLVSNTGSGTTSVSEATVGDIGENVLVYNSTVGDKEGYTTGNAIAIVDGVIHSDLASAIAAADDGDTVTLLEDEEINTSLELKDGITLDLGGNTLTSTDDYTVVCATGASAEVINGNLTGGTNSTVYNNGTALTLNGVNVTYSGSRCAIQNNTGSLTLFDCTVNGGSGGGIWDFGTKSSVKLTSSTVTGGYFAVYHNGSTAGFTLNAENSTLIGDSEDACAIYVSGSATNTAESAHGMNNIKLTNCTVTGPTGIEGKYTNMVLTNCDITATAEPDFEQNNNGTTALGFAVVSTDNSMEPNSPAPESDITINGGAYDGIVGLGQYEDIDKYEGFQESDYTVTGGSFANPLPSEYRGVGIDAELYSRSNSDTPYSYYSNVEEAMNAAQPGDIVTDLSNVTSSDTRYNVTFNYGNNDSKMVSVSAGATITFTAPTRSGYEFRGWRDGSGELHKAGETVKVTSDMTFTAVWSAINIPDTYDIEIADAANGEVDTSLSNASAGSTITITATPDSGYSVASVTVTGPDGRVDVTRVNATTYTFKMPEGDVTVRVTFTTGLPFTDVSANQWFYEAVSYVYTNGMMEGDSATTFNPDGTMTRAMFWAVLGRIDGATITGTNWADQARDWAMAEGVSDGTDPNGLVTREQMVTMLWRYAGEPESSASLSAYTDADSVSDWAETAMRWAIDEGIITGMTDTTLVPQGTATRAQCAAIFMRFDQM